MANNIARGGYSEPSHTPSVAEMQNSLELWNLEGRQLTLAEWPVQRVLRGEHVRSQEIRVRFKATGEDRILSCTGSAIRDQDGKILMAVFTSADITDRKRAEAVLRHSEKIATQREQFQALAESQRRAREEERTRVARDLHDQIGQILTAIKLDLTWMNRRLPRMSDEFRDRLNGAIGLLNDGVRSVRNICSGLRPGILDDVGLSAAIEWQANEFASRTGIACQASIPAVDIDLEGEQATEIFRIFQECLTNIIRHADAKTVAVSLSLQEETLLLTVKDDGKGFIESEASDSLGFLGMRERAQACGGHVEISSSPGKGTAVTLRVPIHSSELSDNEYAHSDR